MEFLYIAAEICRNLDWFVGRPFETVIHCWTKIKKTPTYPIFSGHVSGNNNIFFRPKLRFIANFS